MGTPVAGIGGAAGALVAPVNQFAICTICTFQLEIFNRSGRRLKSGNCKLQIEYWGSARLRRYPPVPHRNHAELTLLAVRDADHLARAERTQELADLRTHGLPGVEVGLEQLEFGLDRHG